MIPDRTGVAHLEGAGRRRLPRLARARSGDGAGLRNESADGCEVAGSATKSGAPDAAHRAG